MSNTASVHIGVRPATHLDLAALVATLGQERFFRDRLERQGRGEGELLVAWADGGVAGDVYLWLTPADEPEVRAFLPGVPLLNHLEVLDPFRRRGIGSRLVTEAEVRLRESGHGRAALGVGVDNAMAYRLYERLGYVDWGHGTIASSWEEPTVGPTHETVREQLCVLVKDLPAS